MLNNLKITLLISVISVFPGHVLAGDQSVQYNKVHLQASAERDVPNDEMQVIMVTEHQGREPENPSKKVNEDMSWALDLGKEHSDIDVSTKSYQTYPIYNDNQIIGWRVSQELQLKSKNITRLSRLVGKLQSKLQVRQMRFNTTKQTRDDYEDELIEEAMMAFKNKVKIIQKHMDGKDYRIVDLHVNTNGSRPPIVMHERAARMSSMAMADAPAIESGSSKLIVTVSGSVQFF